VIPVDLALILLAGIAFVGFVLDSLFERIRVTSVLPLMLLGVALVHFGLLPASTVALLSSLIPFVSAVTISFILFSVGLGIRVEDLRHVLGRATAFTLLVQLATAAGIATLAVELLGWDPILATAFGFALSGPGSIAVPVLVRAGRLPSRIGTALLFESVAADVLVLLVPLFLIAVDVTGTLSVPAAAASLVPVIAGSIVVGLAAGVFWTWVLDRLRESTAGYTWTLTITMVIATYAASDYLKLSPALTVFLFGLLVGNVAALSPRGAEGLRPVRGWPAAWDRFRRLLDLSPDGIDVLHLQNVQREISFFASSFFFVYIGVLFQLGSLSRAILLVAGVSAVAMLGVRVLFLPILRPYLVGAPTERRRQETLAAFCIPRGLASAIVATVPLSVGLAAPGFLNGVFLGILLSTVVSTVGFFLVVQPPPAIDEAHPPLEPAYAYVLVRHSPGPVVETTAEGPASGRTGPSAPGRDPRDPRWNGPQ